MHIITWERFLENGIPAKHNAKKTSMTIGVFDGVHLGHQALIKQVVSHNAEYTPVVVTFKKNHKIKKIRNMKSKMINEAKNVPKNILSFQQKIKKLKKLGIKIIIVIAFTDEFKKMPGIEFLEKLSEHGNAGFFVIGSNFRCGYKLDTDAEKIKSFFAKKNIPVEIIPEVMEDSIPISSSRIRTAIAEGNFQLAKKMMDARLQQPE